MKHLIAIFVMLALAAPSAAMAQKKVNEYGEEIVNPEMIEQVAPSPKAKAAKAIVETNVDAKAKGAPAPAKKDAKVSAKQSEPAAVEIEYKSYSSSAAPMASGRDRRFRVGIIGPGYGYVNRGVNSVMTIGAEGEYFFFERLSAVMRAEVMTKFKNPTILTLTPRARYVFDLDDHPRWAVYAQAGVGLGLYMGGGTLAAADITVPGGGFWWQWTDKWSVGGDANLHIFVRSSTAVGFTIAPAIRYIF